MIFFKKKYNLTNTAIINFRYVGLMLTSLCLLSCMGQRQSVYRNYAKATLDSVYKYYSVTGTELLRETYPFDSDHKATYLASQEQASKSNAYSYVWPYSGSFSAVNALFQATKKAEYKTILDNKVLVGLEEYFDEKRLPGGYASYINTASVSDRFYDDNIWIGIDFAEAYFLTKDIKYLNRAKDVWAFLLSGKDDKLGGGIYWVEQRQTSKHTCSNAPAAVFVCKMFEATKDSSYLKQAEELYKWTKKNLQDTQDYLYYDNINLEGDIDKAKYSYNSGQMLQAAALLYKLTGNNNYLIDAQNLATACYDYFFTKFTTPEGEEFKIFKKGNLWFNAIMTRGYIELYSIDGNKTYLQSIQKNLDYAWMLSRDEKGLFVADFSGEDQAPTKWLLTQFGFIEMYASMSRIKL